MTGNSVRDRHDPQRVRAYHAPVSDLLAAAVRPLAAASRMAALRAGTFRRTVAAAASAVAAAALSRPAPYVVAAVVLGAVVYVMVAEPLERYQELRAEEVALEQERDALVELTADIAVRQARMRTPSGVETHARARFGLVADDETPVALYGPRVEAGTDWQQLRARVDGRRADE